MRLALRLALALAILVFGTALVLGSVRSARDTTTPRDALIRAPLDDRALEALVRADDAAGRWAEEKRLIAVSTSLTKRNLPIRFMALAIKAADGDLAGAVRDADLLLRQQAYQAPVFTFLRDAAASAEGRDAIATRLAARPPWRVDLLVHQRGLIAAGHGDAVALLTTMKAIAPPTDDEIESLAETIVAANDVDAAFALRAAFAPGRDLLIDRSFRRPGSSRSGLLGWAFGDTSGHDDRVRQITFADPGRHVLSWKARTPGSTIAASGPWTMRCLQPTHFVTIGPVSSETNHGVTTSRRTVDIPGGCPAQFVSLPRDAAVPIQDVPPALRVDLS
ncbi:hypothetical protein GGQ80_001805 [Sphingomonas jinjuensis]|uniref:Uncharacterized protein n=1 Tax=Sphingomonas jinjuensis TaxID=535907 RepID=A0A840F844_9SPHN|nr:hypothetical protein [Sphingomonas jinjuensis]MBB4153899.1 hypothetical protein [Sphingomonas jinjuensis]